MVFAKLAATLGALGFLAGAAGVASTGVMAAAAVLMLAAAVAGAIALEERDSVEGLVVHDLRPEAPMADEPAADVLAA